MLEPAGHCYRWAANFASKHPGAVVHHGTIQFEQRAVLHAWVEWKGRVYDYQANVMGRAPMTLAAWYRKNDPTTAARYRDEKALVLALKHGQWGPF